METIREWASKVTEKQRGNFSGPLTYELLNQIQEELLSATPDYEGCIIALTTLHHQSIAVFYERVYPQLSKSSKQSINTALLDFARTRLGKAAACSRIAQAIRQRLRNGESAESLTPELLWYTGTASEKILQNNLKNIWHDCGTQNCLKLFELDLTNWKIDSLKLQNFYSHLFQMLRTADGKTDWNSVFIAFLEKNHLNDSETINQSASRAPLNNQQNALASNTSTEKAPSSLPAQSSASDKIVDVRKDPEDEVADKASSLAEKPMVHNLPEPPTASHKESSDLSPEIFQPEPDPDKDGVKLAERLLAWARTQVQGTAILKSSLKTSNNDLKRLEERFSNLQSELFAAKEEVAAKEVTITALQRDLAATQARLESEQAKSAELDGMISKLQQMNENTATQAVLGYKAELASALKSIVEDARLPEAQHDAEILSALLADLLDTLHFKGVPLEVDEK